MREAVIVATSRTPVARSFSGALSAIRPDDLAARCIWGAMHKLPKLDPVEVDDVILGMANMNGAAGPNMARSVAILAGLPVGVAGLTVDRSCASGLQAIAIAAQQIIAGTSDVVIAGGVESPSFARGKYDRPDRVNPRLNEIKPAIYLPALRTAEIVAKRYQVSRRAQDEHALLSRQRYAAALKAHAFRDEIVPVGKLAHDECDRPGATLAELAGLPPLLPEGTVTEGNSAQLADGAAVAVLMSAEKAARAGIAPLGIFRGFTVCGCEPDEAGICASFAIPKLLKSVSMNMDDVDVVELNESFAAQAVYCRERLGIDPARLNPNGGSIAVGDPLGMTGALQVGQVLAGLRRRGQRYAVVATCMDGGMGAAGLLEALA